MTPRQKALPPVISSSWKSRRSRARVRVTLSQRVTPGTLFLAFHYPETHTNRLTSAYTDPESKCPEYKITAVRLQPIHSVPLS